MANRRRTPVLLGATSIGALCGLALGGPLGAAIGGAVSAATVWLTDRQLGRIDAFQRAWVDEDTVALRKLLPQVARYVPRPHHRFYEATVLAFGEGKYEEALALLEEQPVPPELGVHTALCRAWCLLHTERTREAVEVLGSAGHEADAKCYRLGVLGAAAVLEGRHQEGIETLARAASLAGEGQPHLRAACAYYTGEAQLALGDRTRAEESFSDACALAPGGPFADLALERLV
jgi:tetratricopeptide (TPR) repeat protein